MEFRTMTVGDMLEGFIDNMSSEQIDKEIKLFEHINRTLERGRHDYAEIGIIVDEDHIVDSDMLKSIKTLFGYQPYLEKNEASGFVFLYFKSIEDAETASAYLKAHAEE